MRPSLDGPVEPNPSDVVLCSYPATMDGTAAAWVVYKIAKRDHIPLQFVTAEPGWKPEPKDILNRNWIAIGDAPAGTFGKGLLSITRERELQRPVPLAYAYWKRTVPFGIEKMSTIGKSCGINDPQKSLCRMTWDFFFAERVGFDRPPRLITHIDDFTTGTLRYNDSRPIATSISTYPKELPIYDRLALALEDRRKREAAIAGGQAVLRYIETLQPGQERNVLDT